MVKPVIIETQRFEDFRGWLSVPVESNVEFHVFQVNQGFSKKAGTLRGLHFQEGEHAQAKLVSCLHVLIFNVAVDLRPGDTYTSIQLSLSKVMRFYNRKNAPYRTKIHYFPHHFPKSLPAKFQQKRQQRSASGQGERPGGSPGPRTLRGVHAISHEKCMRIKSTTM